MPLVRTVFLAISCGFYGPCAARMSFIIMFRGSVYYIGEPATYNSNNNNNNNNIRRWTPHVHRDLSFIVPGRGTLNGEDNAVVRPEGLNIHKRRKKLTSYDIIILCKRRITTFPRQLLLIHTIFCTLNNCSGAPLK